MRGFDNPYPLDMVTDPFSDHLDVLRPDEIRFVEHHQVRKADLPQLEQVYPLVVSMREDPDGVDDAGAVPPDCGPLRVRI